MATVDAVLKPEWHYAISSYLDIHSHTESIEQDNDDTWWMQAEHHKALQLLLLVFPKVASGDANGQQPVDVDGYNCDAITSEMGPEHIAWELVFYAARLRTTWIFAAIHDAQLVSNSSSRCPPSFPMVITRG